MPRKNKPIEHKPRSKRPKISKHSLRKSELDVLERTGEQVDHLTPKSLYRRTAKSKSGNREEDVGISSDPNVLWRGEENAIVEIKGMYFRLRQVGLASRKIIWVIYLIRAGEGTPLVDIAGTNIYVSVGQLHMPTFASPLIDGSDGWEIQLRMWNFLSHIFVEYGIKKPR